VLHCAIRGIDPVCHQCQAKRFSLCENIVDGCVAPGLFAGYNADLGGAWGEAFLAHRSMLFPIPDAVADEDAVLLEPFCSALHPVLKNPPPPGGRAVVFGCGTLGLMTIAALRASGFDGRILAIAKYDFQAAVARRWGADEIVSPTSGLLRDVADRMAARYLKGSLGPALLLGGPEIVYDCVGNSWSVQQSLQMTRGGGKVVLIGIAADLAVDSSCLWIKEVALLGSCGSGGEVPGQPGRRTMDQAIEYAAAGTIRLRQLLTHTFPLAEYRSALQTALGKRRSRALKVAFDFRRNGPEEPRTK
jgi:L-iditol 2-dehydrogenase